MTAVDPYLRLSAPVGSARSLPNRRVLRPAIWMPFLLPALILSGWEVGSHLGVISTQILPRPSAVLAKAWQLALSGELFLHLGVSALRAFAGLAIGGTMGFALGMANGLSQRSALLTDTTVQMVRNIPILALIPLVIIWFGVGEVARLFLVAISVFFRSTSIRSTGFGLSIRT